MLPLTNPAVKAGLQGTRRVLARQGNGNGLEQGAFARAVVARENRPARMAAIWSWGTLLVSHCRVRHIVKPLWGCLRGEPARRSWRWIFMDVLWLKPLFYNG